MRAGQVGVLAEVFVVAIIVVLSFLAYFFVMGSAASNAHEEIHIMLPPTVLGVTTDQNLDTGLTDICITLKNNASEALEVNTIHFLVDGKIANPFRATCGPEIQSDQVCTVCAQALIVHGGQQEITIIAGAAPPTKYITDVAESPVPDLAISNVFISNGLVFSPPDTARYAERMFNGDYNKVTFVVTIKNVSKYDQLVPAVLELSGPCVVDKNVVVVGVPGYGEKNVKIETNTTAPGECNITVRVDMPNDPVLGNNQQTIREAVWAFGFCDGCDDETNSCSSRIVSYAGKEYNALVVLTRDDNYADTTFCMNIYAAPTYDLSRVVFDGNGHVLTNLSGGGIVVTGLGLTVTHVKVDAAKTAFVQNYRSPGKPALELQWVDLNGGSYGCYASIDVNIQHANIYANDANGVALYAQNDVTLRLLDVNLWVSDPTGSFVIFSDYAKVAEANNVLCNGTKRYVAITAETAADYNNTPLDANAFCGFSIMYPVILDFNGTKTDARSFYIHIVSGSTTVKNLEVNAVSYGARGVNVKTSAYLEDVNIIRGYPEASALVASGWSPSVTTNNVRIFGNVVGSGGGWAGTIRLRDTNVFNTGTGCAVSVSFLTLLDLSGVNISVQGGGIPLCAYHSTVELNNVWLATDGNTFYRADEYTTLSLAKNATCAGEGNIVLITPANAAVFNGVVDANALCHVFVDGATVTLDLNGATRQAPSAPYLMVDSGTVTLKNVALYSQRYPLIIVYQGALTLLNSALRDGSDVYWSMLEGYSSRLKLVDVNIYNTGGWHTISSFWQPGQLEMNRVNIYAPNGRGIYLYYPSAPTVLDDVNITTSGYAVVAGSTNEMNVILTDSNSTIYSINAADFYEYGGETNVFCVESPTCPYYLLTQGDTLGTVNILCTCVAPP